jgi:multiple sugar transport system substrate-binding protein
MRRFWMIAAAIGLVSAYAFGNGQKEGSTANGPITLTVWDVFDPAQGGDGKSYQEKFAEYHQLNPNITIEHDIITYDQLRQKAIVAGQAQQGPDILHMLGEWVPDFVSQGILEDLTAPMKSWSDYSEFPESTWKVASVGDKIYGVPITASTRVLLYRSDLFQKYGVQQVPKTWSDMRQAAKQVTEGLHQDGLTSDYGMAFCSASSAVRGPQEFAVLLWSTGGDFVKNEGGKWVPGFTVDQAKEVYQLYYDMMFVDKSLPPDSIGWEWQQLDPAMQTGTVAMEQNGSWMQGRAAQADSGKYWRTAPFPYDKRPATYLEVKVDGVSKFAQHKDQAITLLKWLFSRDNMVYLARTDNLPSRIDAKDSKYWKNDPIWRGTFLDTVKDGFSMPSIPFDPALKFTMDDLQEVFYQKMSPDQAASDFYNKVKNYLDTSVNNH